jgi:uncharacterized protein YecA (UPF0149 family)
MIARVSSNVLTALFQVEAEKEELEAMEEEEARKHLEDLQKAVARHPGEDDDLGAKQRQVAKGQETAKRSAAPAVRSTDPCPCGSGRKFRECHGAALDDDAA